MMHHAAQQNSIEARVGKRQLLDVAGDELKLRIFAAANREQFRAEVHTDTGIACSLEEMGERPRPAT